MLYIKKFVGQYRVFLQKYLNGKPSKNQYDTYLLHKTGQIYRYSENTLALFLNSTQSKNKYIPILDENNIKYKEFISGESEYIFHFPEKQLPTVAKIVNVQRKFKNEFPNFED